MQKTLGNQDGLGDNSGTVAGAGNTKQPPLTTDADGARDMMAASDSIPGKAPAFQFYANEFLMDEHVSLMSMQERGVYITLICKCWNEGSLPDDTERLARLCGVPLAAFRKAWPAIQPCFRSNGSDRLLHPRLEKERKKQRDYRRRQSDAAAKRWESHGNATAMPRHVVRHPPGIATQPPSGNALISVSSQSLSQTQSQRPIARESSELGERAGRFLERYGELYQKHRKGARYLSKPALDFQEAMQLCRTWDDARLEKLAVIFLTTDHEFAEKGSRTIAQFRSMASWCDGRLAEAGIA